MTQGDFSELDHILPVQIHVGVEKQPLKRVAGRVAEHLVEPKRLPVGEEQPAVFRQAATPTR